MEQNKIDLLADVGYGGCSAKLDPTLLSGLLDNILPKGAQRDPNILVGLSTHDDAGVYRLSAEQALIVTTDFFPPVVADPYTFGRIAATNALSDVYAMGGTPLLSLNLVHYPSRLPMEGLSEILRGGESAVQEAGAITMGGHTIEDATPQYGLAVVGLVHPDRLVTNAGAREGDLLILTKPLGVGVVIAAQRLGMVQEGVYQEAKRWMSTLNRNGADVMRSMQGRCATDVTGFGLLGHTLEMAEASDVTIEIEGDALPVLPQAIELLEEGCIPGAAFRNLRYVGDKVELRTSTTLQYLAADPQTSGGLLMALPPEKAHKALVELHSVGLEYAAIVGRVSAPREDIAITLM